jgi:crossover junction endodeoxyribonuclease RuvC
VLVYIGVDPGVTGAIVAIGRDGTLIGCSDMPIVNTKPRKEVLVTQLAGIFKQYARTYGADEIFCTLEKHTPRPGQGISGQCKLAKICGQVEGIVAALGMAYQVTHPRTWSKVMRDVEGKDLKARSVIAAGRRFPDLDLSLKKHHNRADAALLAEFGRLYHDAEA